MSKIAYRLTGMTKKEFREYTFSSIGSKNQVFYDPRVPVRNTRLSNGMYVGIEDLNPLRKKLRKSTPKCLKITLVDRIKSYLNKN